MTYRTTITNNMNNKTLVTIGAVATALTLPTFAANTVTDGARALAHGTANTGKSLLKAPTKLLKIGDNSLPNLSAGVQEFGLSGNVDYADDIAYNINLSYGYFFRDNWQVGFTTNVSGVESDATFGLGVFTEYNFVGESKWVPFVGGSLKWAKLNSDTAFDADSISLGIDLGVKYFIRENIALSFSLGAEYAFDEVFPGGDDFNKNIRIGTRFYF